MRHRSSSVHKFVSLICSAMSSPQRSRRGFFVRAYPAHRHVEVGFSLGRGDNGSGDGTQLHPNADLDLIWPVSDAAQFLDDALGHRQDLVERLFKRLFRFDDGISTSRANGSFALRLVDFDDNAASFFQGKLDKMFHSALRALSFLYSALLYLILREKTSVSSKSPTN